MSIISFSIFQKKRGKEEKTRYRYDVPKKTFEQMSYM